jgi:hypothetical protein
LWYRTTRSISSECAAIESKIAALDAKVKALEATTSEQKTKEMVAVAATSRRTQRAL